MENSPGERFLLLDGDPEEIRVRDRDRKIADDAPDFSLMQALPLK
jgi:hypothetical protein